MLKKKKNALMVLNHCAAFIVSAFFMMEGELNAASSAPPEKVPALRILAPQATVKPKLDGVMEPGEWDSAVSWSAGGMNFVDARQIQFFVMWDQDNVYVAQCTTLLPGEKLKRIGREPKPDVATAMESEMEVHVDAGTNGTCKMPCSYQLMGNACGNRFDIENQYTIGIRNLGWNGDWQYAQQMTPDGKQWVAEMAIPRKVVFCEEPLKDGVTWKMGFGRDGGPRPTGIFGCAVPVTFRETCPIFHLSELEKCVDNKMAFTLRIDNPTKNVFKGKMTAKMDKGAAPVEIRDLALDPGKGLTIQVDKPAGLKIGEKSNLSIDVCRDDGERVFCWSKPVLLDDLQTKTPFLKPKENKLFDASVTFNPVGNFLRAMIDRYEHPEKDQVASCKFEVRPKGETNIVASGKADKFSYDVATAKIELPSTLPAGEYAVSATLAGISGQDLGKTELTFTKKDLSKEAPWFNNSIGISDRILWPFQPMITEGSVIRPWEREIRLNGLALPASMVTVGHSILAEPVRITGEANGRSFTVETQPEPKPLKATRTMSEFTGTGKGGGVKVTSLLHMDYDGCARIELTLLPESGQKTELDKLAVEIPMLEDQATHMHTFRTDMRNSCYAGLTPPGQGCVWDSSKVPSNTMTAGSFVPLVFLGTPSGGLTWFANSDQGWWPNDEYPGLEIVRKPGQVILRLNLASEKVILSGERKIVFGLHVSPVRPLDVKTWTPGTGIQNMEEFTGRFDSKTQSRPFYLYPANASKFNDYVSRKFKGGPGCIYSENFETDVPAEDSEYFRDIWTGGREKTLTDCSLYWAKKLLEDCPNVHGIYIDNIFPHETKNIEAGSAYVLPDGRVQPGFDIWEHRDYVRRLRTLMQDMRLDPHGIEVHMTMTMVIPIYSWADCMLEGENPLEADNGRKDFADLYPPAFSAIMNNPQAWGIVSEHLWNSGANKWMNSLSPEERWKALRPGIGQLALYGNMFPRPNVPEYLNMIAQYHAIYGGVSGTERFLPYWDTQGLFKVMTPDVLATVRVKPDRLVVWIMNYARQEQEVSVWLDLPRLLTDTASSTLKNCDVFDIETARPQPIQSPFLGTEQEGKPGAGKQNTIKVKVGPRDFKIILIMARK
jgi:hypothetical protein